MTDKTPLKIEPPRLLVVDDDEALCKSLAAILKKAGYEIATAETGAAAIDAVKQAPKDKPIHAVLIDIRLPDINGLEVLRSIRKIKPDTGAIMMTGYTDTETAVGALNEGAFAYIQKPYNVVEVKATIERWAEKQRLIEENKRLLKQLVEWNAELEKRVEERTHELKLANINLLKTIDKLKEADAAKSDFISMVSHELRTPLTVISGFAQTCLNQIEKIDRDTLQHYLGIIHAHGLMLTRLIESILDLSQIRDRGMNLTYEKLNLQELVENVVEGVKIIKPAMRYAVSFEGADRDIISDKSRIQQVFINLIGNAIKYTSDKGSIQIRCWREDSEWVASVKDDGPGIPTDIQEKIFEPFFRAKDAINMKTPGTGLGLTITKAIVQALGGKIWVESKPDGGCAFFFSLPKKGQPLENEPAKV
jgi:signal transduction histidine kinase